MNVAPAKHPGTPFASVNLNGVPEIVILRFWEKVKKKRGKSACWVWTATKSPSGYGKLNFRMPDTRQKVSMSAHRFSFALHFEEVPPRMHVLHKCDNPSCVRPDHLFLGNELINSHDCISKGRLRFTYGMKSRFAKLTDNDVVEIRRLCTSEGVSRAQLSKQFNTHVSNISLIVRRKKWKHLP